MIILKTKDFTNTSDNKETSKWRDLMGKVLKDSIKEDKRSRRKKEFIDKIKDAESVVLEKIKKNPVKSGIIGLGSAGLGTATVIGGRKLKKKHSQEKSNERVKKSITEE